MMRVVTTTSRSSCPAALWGPSWDSPPRSSARRPDRLLTREQRPVPGVGSQHTNISRHKGGFRMEMGMPTVQEQHKKLQTLAGTWTGEEKMHPSPWDPEGGMALGKVNNRIDLDGFF